MITVQERNMLEQLLKTWLHVLFQERHQIVKNAERLANIKDLKERRIVQITRVCLLNVVVLLPVKAYLQLQTN